MSGSSEGQKTAKKGSKIVFLGQPVYLIYQLFARDDFETVTFTIMGNYFYPGGRRQYGLRVPFRRLSPNMFLWNIIRDYVNPAPAPVTS